MSKLWLNDGRVVLDAAGRLTLCDLCPCDEATGTGTGTGTGADLYCCPGSFGTGTNLLIEYSGFIEFMDGGHYFALNGASTSLSGTTGTATHHVWQAPGPAGGLVIVRCHKTTFATDVEINSSAGAAYRLRMIGAAHGAESCSPWLFQHVGFEYTFGTPPGFVGPETTGFVEITQ